MNELKEIKKTALQNVTVIAAENKDKIQQAYEWLMRLEYRMRKEGLMALEIEAGYIPPKLPLCNELVKMVYMITQGVDEVYMAEFMTIQFLGGDYQGIEALLFYLYARGILMMREGESAWLIETFFQTVIPNSILEFNKKSILYTEEKGQMVERIKDNLSIHEKDKLLEFSNLLQSLSEEEWTKVVMCKGFDEIVPYADLRTKELIAQHVNVAGLQMMMEYARVLKEEDFDSMIDDLVRTMNMYRRQKNKKSMLKEILTLDKTTIEKVLSVINGETLALALKGETQEILDTIYQSMSLRERYQLQEDMDYMGPVRLCDVETAQKELLHAIKGQMKERGI